MALNKEIDKENGVVTTYHRITKISKITNNCNIIYISSYISKDTREKEKESEGSINTVIDSACYTKDYNEEEDIKSVYEYLKTLPDFEGATDI